MKRARFKEQVKRTCYSLPVSLFDRFAAIAKREDRGMSEMAREAIDQIVAKMEKTEKGKKEKS